MASEPVAMCPTVGALPDGWQLKRLGEFCTKIGTGATPRGGSEVYLSSRVGHALIRSQHVFDRRFDEEGLAFISPEHAVELRNAEVQCGDVLLNITGDGVTFGRSCIVPDAILPACVNQHVSIIRPDPNFCHPGYLLAVLTHPSAKGYIESFNSGGSRRAITKGHIESFGIALPPLAEQKAMAAMLAALDEKIELNRRMNATLEAMARALFQSWFVDFDPVRAKLDGRKPVGLDADTVALFPDSFQESEIGHIPLGWNAVSLPQAIEVNPRRTLRPGTLAPYLDMKNLPTQGHSAGEIAHREFSSGSKFQNGDTLLARITPCLENGKTGYVDFLAAGKVGWGSTEYIVFAPKPPLPAQFGYFLARSTPLRSHAIRNMTGTSGRQRVPSECFETFMIVVPPANVAHRFDDLTAPIMAKIKANSYQSRILAVLRDALLPKLLSGEVRVTPIRAEPTKEFLFPMEDAAPPGRSMSETFAEAVLIAKIVQECASAPHPIGRKRYNKMAYFAHRKAEEDVSEHYLKKAAGPYSPWSRYEGPESIAIRNGYVAVVKKGDVDTFLAGGKVAEIERYAAKIPACKNLPWVFSHFDRYTRTDDLELFATVDFAALDLVGRGEAVSVAAVQKVIASNKEWAPKLTKSLFSAENIGRAIDVLSPMFPKTYLRQSEQTLLPP